MFTIYLPGFSVGNREEANNIVTTLRANDFDVYYEGWPHWDDESIKFDTEREVKRLIAAIGENKVINIVAKSYGTFVAVSLVAALKSDIKIDQLILMGIPLLDLSTEDQKRYRKDIIARAERLTIIHNEFDSHGSWLQVEELLRGNDYESIVKLGIDNHKYDYPSEVLSILEN